MFPLEYTNNVPPEVCKLRSRWSIQIMYHMEYANYVLFGYAILFYLGMQLMFYPVPYIHYYHYAN